MNCTVYTTHSKLVFLIKCDIYLGDNWKIAYSRVSPLLDELINSSSKGEWIN